MARLLILDGHSAAALAITRSAGRAGHWIAVGSNQGSFAPAALSRFCTDSFEYPASTDDCSAFIESVVKFVKEKGIDLVVPVTEWTTLPLAKCSELFMPYARVAVPAYEALEVAADKSRTTEVAGRLGIPVPKTIFLDQNSSLSELDHFNFPAVVKDRYSARWQGNKAVLGSVAYTYTRDALVRKVQEKIEAAGDVLVQEFVSGVGVGFSCFVSDREVRLPFQWKRVREVDPRGSASSCRAAVSVEPNIERWSKDLILSIGFSGIAMVEFKRSQRSFALMEINGRPWGSIQLAISAGIDYPRYWIDWHLNNTVPPKRISYHSGITCRRLIGELTHLSHLRAGKPKDWPLPYPSLWKTALRIAVPWFPGVHYDEFAAGDFGPGKAILAKWWQDRFG